MEFGAFFADAGAKAQAAIDDAIKVGVPALQAAAEQWGIDVLTEMNKEHTKELNAAVKEVTATSPAPGTFGAALNATVKGSLLQNNGLMIVGVVVAILAVGYFMRGK